MRVFSDDASVRFESLAWMLGVVVSIVLHELAHGIVADKLGDPTARIKGHLTLNPLVHISPFGFVALLVVGICWGAMPVDGTRLKGKYAEAKVAFAGPLVNLVLGVLALIACGLVIRLIQPEVSGAWIQRIDNLQVFLWIFGWLNFVLFVFNLIPVYPLDGSRILADFSSGYRKLMIDSVEKGWNTMLFLLVFITAGQWMGVVAIPAKALVALVVGM